MSIQRQKTNLITAVSRSALGSTLIEVMLAIAILIIAVFGTSASFVTGRGQIAKQQHYRAAANLASQKIEQIKALAYSDINEIENEEELEMYDWTYQRHTEIKLMAEPTAELPKPCKKATVTIEWTGSAGDAHEVKFVTYLGP
jgi:type II secretory pathway pseudopilin PulG